MYMIQKYHLLLYDFSGFKMFSNLFLVFFHIFSNGYKIIKILEGCEKRYPAPELSMTISSRSFISKQKNYPYQRIT